jgi:hypothetical protein
LLQDVSEMTARHRLPIAAAGVVLSVALTIGCDGLLDFGHRDLANDPPPPPPTQTDDRSPPVQTDASVAVGDPPPPPTCRAVPEVAGFDYQAMCRHYCDTLDETLRYASLAGGQAPAPADAGGVSQQCWELRCVPRCVDQALCFTQCDADATQYAPVCADADAGADDAVCPSSPDDHLAACRAGCSPPPLPPPPGLP